MKVVRNRRKMKDWLQRPARKLRNFEVSLQRRAVQQKTSLVEMKRQSYPTETLTKKLGSIWRARVLGVVRRCAGNTVKVSSFLLSNLPFPVTMK